MLEPEVLLRPVLELEQVLEQAQALVAPLQGLKPLEAPLKV
jgi:hypothetical protein